MKAGLASVMVDVVPVPPFDFARTRAFHRQFAPNGREAEFAAEVLTRAVRVAGQTIVFRIMSSGTIDAPHLQVTFFSERPLEPDVLAAAVDRVRFFLSLDDDLRPFYALAREDVSFRPVLENQYGYHQVKFLTPFENACWSILTQRTQFAVAWTFKQRLMDQFGGRLTIDGVNYDAFPQPEDFGAVSPADLAELVSNERRGKYLYSVVTAFQDVDEMWLREGNYDEVEAWLRRINGIGDWSALFILLRGLGRTEKALIKDENSHLVLMTLQSAEAVYGVISVERLRELADYYGSYQGYWTHYLRANTI